MHLVKRAFGREMISTMLVAAGCLALSSSAVAQVHRYIMTWGTNAPAWNSALGVNAIRLGCSSAPSGCVQTAERIARSQQIHRVFLAMTLDVGKTRRYAHEYSRFSLSSRVVFEIGFDDFVGQSEKEHLPPPALSNVLSEISRASKSANPKLQFGITLYMDEVNSPRFPLAELSDGFRQSVDFVHLYPHYRKESETFEASLRQVRGLFPNAKVIAGLYAYDRRDYLPCARGSRSSCSNEEEIELFRQSLEDRLALLRNGDISGIEFYPGNFGLEDRWEGWQNPRTCQSSRRQECITNTKQMREIVRSSLAVHGDH